MFVTRIFCTNFTAYTWVQQSRRVFCAPSFVCSRRLCFFPFLKQLSKECVFFGVCICYAPVCVRRHIVVKLLTKVHRALTETRLWRAHTNMTFVCVCFLLSV
eukprot:GEMP01008835.1.p2 GENE.GEMP01008835.1~~GEMP01008835.1.p2  ORF type:complete len:102 (+),score=2.10 GEMP01008835.1:2659-2964(+)